MQTNVIIGATLVGIMCAWLGWLVARWHTGQSIAAAKEAADRRIVAMKAERDSFKAKFSRAVMDLEAGFKDSEARQSQYDQSIRAVQGRNAKLQEENAALVKRLAERDKLHIATPKAQANSLALADRVKSVVGDRQEIPAEQLANKLAGTDGLHGNRLREEIKPIMRSLGYQEKRTSHPGRRGQYRIWRKG